MRRKRSEPIPAAGEVSCARRGLFGSVDDQATGNSDATQGTMRSVAGAHANVMIPLPMAAWSGLSVLGGVGFVAGIRRAVRRFL